MQGFVDFCLREWRSHDRIVLIFAHRRVQSVESSEAMQKKEDLERTRAAPENVYLELWVRETPACLPQSAHFSLVHNSLDRTVDEIGNAQHVPNCSRRLQTTILLSHSQRKCMTHSKEECAQELLGGPPKFICPPILLSIRESSIPKMVSLR
ncbi:hypothetical protein Ddc_01026 [Ditylenchus destructor]|nr:hypothetical protein Ddc_01026 [Ditylenchus destructor]